ncbi:unnamed protein product [Polarella glacialis]|uniref:Glucosidase 2 subunit beta n=1 Tax=Polarella glacialis TaxID=89957 RepID=A0A813EMN8_POLGL|nr:unnamed protein product [Polarella glacialis]
MSSGRLLLVLLGCLVGEATTEAAWASLLRGVGPVEEERYAAASSVQGFRCLSGAGQSIPLDAVNDNYCDCPDGSDEPGTAACAGQEAGGADRLFFCANSGSQRRYIYRSHVNDGICDCCDGSDEWLRGVRSCPDTCDEEGRGFREAQEAKLVAWQAGIAMQKTSSSTWAESRQLESWASEASQLRLDIPVLERGRDAKKRALDELARSKLPEVQMVQAEIAKAETEEPQKPKISEYAKWMEAGGDAAASIPAADAAKASTSVDEAAAASKGSAPALSTEESEEIDAFREAESAWSATKEMAQKAKVRLRGLEACLDPYLDGGLRALAALLEKCLKHREGTSKYKVCFFRSATQDTGSEKGISLGRWLGWDFSEGISIPRARFARGAACGSGGRRSLTVSFLCGGEAAIQSVSEPTTCAYEMDVLHPAACNVSAPPEKTEQPARLPRDEL